jgi:hypothetical protein
LRLITCVWQLDRLLCVWMRLRHAWLTNFCLKRGEIAGQQKRADTESAVECVSRAVRQIHEYLGAPFPFGRYKQVFVDAEFA